jgi:uncharacterized membrane protein
MGHRGSRSADDRYDLQILKERCARDEITRAEYEESRQVLLG